ncbi:MAG: DUF2703 domain-containing protein [Candidatus Electrothrix sp. AUS4]|nr:DUF2703 domain-containing protein [Candidatus Electrothrix sp. AUS4]
MKTLAIEWRRFEQQGDTCVRCSETGASLQQALHVLTDECGRMGCGRFVSQKQGWRLNRSLSRI